ncbi:iron-containing alcohol dehydrogenase [uncultured Duncaniella sp.]|uniref:iron-containing alcohol dehydrogenase n=1 Tax=uncultured Duncaniella sp. TaxID=2768039 RepID=UPI0025E8F819|nr:iron-containing alcohol dehydrogenase [uncultured Duncaniella sp.]
MKPITILQPQKIVFGSGCIQTFVDDYLSLGFRRLFVLTAPPILPLIEPAMNRLKENGVSIEVCHDILAEPTLNDFNKILDSAREFRADSVVGIGGGSVLDVAKLVAAFIDSDQKAEDCFGTGFIKKKGLWLACLPTTAGTGSEVSPNAILLDERDRLKKGIVSPYLLADTAYVDPMLTMTVPSKVTADTGMDALTHCIEAYTNKFAHPAVDIYALQGIKLIAANLLRAVRDGNDTEAREAMSLGSLYGGLVLGPVNTAAVHALSYPLGGEFHIPHGLSNAILLPSVMKFNRPANLRKYAEVAIACGAPQGKDDNETAQNGVDFIYELSKAVGIPQKLSDLNIPQSAVDGMAKAAMEVQRLLKNNPREVTEQDARDIYNSLY